ncbi:MAG: TrmH family RNA methyltransferase, partial [Bacteriovoracaceae bacterium]
KDEIDELPIIHKTFFNQKDMKSLVGYVYHKGIIGIGKRPEYSDLNSLNGTTFFLNSISSPENVGNICRSLAAFNIKNLVVDKGTVDPFIRRSIRVSMGNVFALNIYRINSIQEVLDKLYSKDFHIYGADRRIFSKDIHTVNTQSENNLGIIIGSEGHGIDPNLYESLTGVVHIPINEDVGYLNAANAASILAYYFRSHL